MHSACRYSDLSTIEWMLKKNANIEATNDRSETPLNFIISEEKMSENEKIPIASLLLQYKANVDSTDSLGRTPLHWACIFGSEVMVAMLLKHNADITETDDRGKTPLHYAAQDNHQAIVDLLIAKKR